MASRSREHRAEPSTTETTDTRRFGVHVRGLRRVRRLTQEQLAERADLAPDTIRRVEHGAFSPSLETITKLCRGLELARSTLFESFELGEPCPAARELIDLVRGRSDDDVEFGLAALRTIFDQLDRRRASAPAPERPALLALYRDEEGV